MTRFLSLLGLRGSAGTRRRGDAASGRLRAAHLDFDDSIVALRKAALDHVDVQDLASTALRANLDRIVRRLQAPG